MIKIYYKYFLAICFIFSVVSGMAQSASAADFTPPPFNDKRYAGKYVNQSINDPITITAGETKQVIVRIKNTGKLTWYSTGKNFVSAYTVGPNYRASAFAGSNWIGKDQPAKIDGTIKPNSVGDLVITLHAPEKIGDYTERFYLAAENKTWISGSYFYFKIKVVKRTTDNRLQTTDTTTTSDGDVSGNSAAGIQDQAMEINKEYASNLLAFSARKITATGGQQVSFIVRYLNNGTQKWSNYLWQEAGSSAGGDVAIASVSKISLADTSWKSSAQIAYEDKTINPGGSLEIPFTFRAPAKKGTYVARFQLTANSHTLDGGTLELPITVTADAPVDYQEPNFSSQIIGGTRQLISEPSIRVGLYKVDKPVQVKSNFDYQVYAGSVLQGVLSANDLATLSYNQGNYSFKSDSLNFDSVDYIRLTPNDISNYFILKNYDRKVSWKGAANFNVYRGVMEFKYSPKSDAPYVINELPLDLYIAGIAETSNGAAMEYIKALLVAARSYAYYHLYNGTPADQRTYDVVATTGDQLYLGYNSEVLMPRVVQAQQATYGQMVTYQGTPVITPYYGHSDGHTRTWKQVWGGTDKPWLQSVDCFYDVGYSMFGHGVGLSAQDAAHRADTDGWTYDQLLKYYYTGVQVERIY